MEIKKVILIIIMIANIGLVKAQYTAIPDIDFEQALIDQGIDSENTLDGQVLTNDINTITTLNVSYGGIYSLEGIQDFSLLETLYCHFNYISTLNLSNNLNLKNLYLYSNNLTILNLNSNILLENLNCDYNQISNLGIQNCTNLTFLSCVDNLLNNLNLLNSPNLLHLNASYNQMTSIDISQNINLEVIVLSHNNITELSLDFHNDIRTVFCNNNNINTLNLDSNLALERLYCGQNNLVSLNLNNNTNLNVLSCTENNLNTLTIQNGTNNLLNGTYTIGPDTYNRFNSTNNPNLNCIFVDNAINSTTNWLSVDAISNFVETQTACGALTIPNYSIETKVRIYPNPTQSYFRLKTNATIKKVKLYNVLGKLIKTYKYQDTYMIDKIEKGVYLIMIETKKRNITTNLIIN